METGGKRFERFWSQALLTVSAAEDEASKVLARVGWSPDEVKRNAREFGERLSSQRKAIEHGLDEAVKKAVAKLKVPRREELHALTARLDAITRRLEALSK